MLSMLILRGFGFLTFAVIKYTDVSPDKLVSQVLKSLWNKLFLELCDLSKSFDSCQIVNV